MAEPLVLGEPGKEYISLNLTIEEAAWLLMLTGHVGGSGRLREVNDPIYYKLAEVVMAVERTADVGFTESSLATEVFGAGSITVNARAALLRFHPQLRAEADRDGGRCGECGGIDYEHYNECSYCPHNTNEEDT